jgi:predicted membrane protein
MDEDIREKFRKRGARGRITAGFFMLIIGGVLLLQKINNPFPAWLFTWPVILIAFGVFAGIRKKFRGGGWLVLILLGGFNLAGIVHPEWKTENYFWPALLILVGLAFMLRPRGNCYGRRWSRWDNRWNRWEDWHKDPDEKKNSRRETYSSNTDSGEDLLDIVSVFGGTKKVIMSKDFKGGEVTSFLGGTELDLSRADINGRVVLDLTQVLGGTKLIVPSHWDIKPELSSVFGSIEDKRQPGGVIDPTKILVLKGSSVFGGIEIRSF